MRNAEALPRLLLIGVALLGGACGGNGDSGPGGGPPGISVVSGDRQTAARNAGAALDLVVKVNSDSSHPESGATVQWFVIQGDGSPANASSTTDAQGRARVGFQFGPNYGVTVIGATAAGLTDTVLFSETAVGAMNFLAGGGNVPERYSSDLTVHGDYAYTGSWNWAERTTGVFAQGASINVFHLDGTGAPTRGDSVLIHDAITLSDLQVSDDGQYLVASAEGDNNGGTGGGLYVYSLTDPAHPAFVARYIVSPQGLHTAQLAMIGEKLYAFGARNPANPALMLFDLSQLASDTIILASTTGVPSNYGLHDTFVRDGIAFLFVWNSGVMLYDVGNGIKGGSPTSPKLISSANVEGGYAHNGWWFWGPGGAKRYLFVGQEGPGAVGSSSSGDIHVIDVSDLEHPVEVAFFHKLGAGPHNFWLDETRQILYAAYYNAGVFAIDVSGTLSGDLAARELAQALPSEATYTWGVQLSGGSLYSIDMLTGFHQLSPLAP